MFNARPFIPVLMLAVSVSACAAPESIADSETCERADTCFEFCLCATHEVEQCKSACDKQGNLSPTGGGWASGGAGPGSGAGGSGAGGSGAGGSGAGGGSGAPAGGSGGNPASGGQGGAQSPAGALASGIDIAEIAVYQGVKISIAKGGSAITNRNAPVVAGRPALVRVFLSPRPGFSPRELLVRLTLAGKNYEKKQLVSAASTDETLASSVNFQLDSSAIGKASDYSVSVEETGAAAGGDTKGARHPSQGTEALGAKDAGGKLDVVIVPIVVGGQAPDTSPARLDAYQQRLFQLYPVPDVTVSLHAPVTYSGSISGKSGSQWGAALDFLYSLRSSEQPSSDKYYYGVFAPAPSFSQYCSGGCIAGLSALSPADDVFSRGSIGLGFFAQNSSFNSPDTMSHELGHAHGLPHAPCGVAGEGPFPYAGAKIGAWGWDLLGSTLLPPTSRVDVMSYCDPTWISDFNYDRLFKRVTHVHGVQSQWIVEPNRAPGRFVSVLVDENGAPSWGHSFDLADPVLGDAVELELLDESGSARGTTSAYRYALSHTEGELLLVRESSFATAHAIRRDGRPSLAVAERR